MNLTQLQNRVRELSEIARTYTPDFVPFVLEGFSVQLRGFGHSYLTLAVHKQTDPVEFATEQAAFMLFLGEHVCPKILAVNDVGYVMEYMKPIDPMVGSIYALEMMLDCYVWSRIIEDAPYAKIIGDQSWREELHNSLGLVVPEWALDEPCLIHGDPTIDNTLCTVTGKIRIADPIPPHRLIRPSIKAIDHAKLLQSLLGWEIVLRGNPDVQFNWPEFMLSYETARRAVFWGIVALKRIVIRNKDSNAGAWAEEVSRELERCAL